MIYAETPRLHLRALEESDLPRLVELIGDWRVAKWMIRAPYPYHFKDAEEFFEIQQKHYNAGRPVFFAIIDKNSGVFMGGAGLHPAQIDPRPEEIILGYWLGVPFWEKGFMSEAVKAAISLAFRRPDIKVLGAKTDPQNEPSLSVLEKSGLKFLGVFPRAELALRGSLEETRWELKREDYEKSANQP